MLSESQQKATLIATILASSMAFIDATALNVALPALQADLDMKASSLMWVINGYALFLSSLLLVGGSIGDRYGRKRIFTIGIIIFTVASIACGFASSSITLIVGRCVQGLGGALMVPGSLSLISASFPKERLGWAIGTWSMFSAMTTVFGPALGGWFAGNDLWRLVFFINVPLAMIAFLFLKRVPESKELPSHRKHDLLGALLATLALGAITFGFIEAPNYSFSSPIIYGSLIFGGALFIAFLWNEKTSTNPMMPLNLFNSRIFSITNLITFFIYAALGGFLFFFPLNLIQVQGYPSEIAGLTLVPFGLLIAFLSRWSGKMADKIGIRTFLILGPMLTAIGFFLFSIPGLTHGPQEFWSTYFPAMMVLGVGMGLTVAPLTTAVMNAAASTRTGTASGINNTVARTAGVLAIAVMGSFALIIFENSFKERTASLQLTTEVQGELSKEMSKLAEAKPPAAATLEQKQYITTSIKYAFIDVFKQSALIATILAGLSTMVSYLFIRKTNTL